ncbi:MAG: hypothetical protein RIS70_143 [Planctomycetota bacterium]
MNGNYPTPIRTSLALFALSTAAVLFSLSLFRLISFFIMPSLFFDLLLVCFPIGAAFAVIWKGNSANRFRIAVPYLQLVMLGTVVATLLLKHVDFMRQNLLFNVSTWSIVIQVLIFSLIYSPFFTAYGATEYLGYLAGQEQLRQRMNGVYAIVLFGAVGGFLISQLQPWLGVARLLVLSIGLLTLVKQLIDSPQKRRRIVEYVLIAAAFCAPGINQQFMQFFKSSKPFSVEDYRQRLNAESLYEGWGRYSYFEVVKAQFSTESVLYGFYNDMNQWAYRRGDSPVLGFRETVLQPFVAGAENVAIIGSGGGRDIKLVRQVSSGRIVAMDVEPAAIQVAQGTLRDEFENVYSLPHVEVQIGDARTYLENSQDRFDAIFFWSVGGYPQLMLEPGNMIRTTQALGGFLKRLSPGGVFCMGYDHDLDPNKVLLQQYATTLRQHGARVIAFEYGSPPLEYSLIAFSPEADKQQEQRWSEIEANIAKSAMGVPIRRIHDQDLEKANFSPVTDDRPYLACNISNILSLADVRFLAYQIGVGLLCICLAIYFVVLGQREGGGVPNFRVQLVAFLLGANFVMLEHVCVLEIFRTQYIYYDALIVGVVAFLTITALGSFAVRRPMLRTLTCISWIGPLAWLVQAQASGTVVTLLALFLATLVTGNLFPTLFDSHPRDRLHIFALDAIGAAAGAMVSFFVPILYGLTLFRVTALVMFLVTSLLMTTIALRSEPRAAA